MAEVTVGSFDGRLSFGASAQDELRRLLDDRRFIITETGQEKYIPGRIHSDLRKIHNDPTVRAIRFQPDFMAYRTDFPTCYWESKACTTDKYITLVIEQSCYDELFQRHKNGQRCIVAFRYFSGKWVASWVQEILIVEKVSEDNRRHMARGSMTPYYRISRRSFLSLDLFISWNALKFSKFRSQPVIDNR